MKISQLASCVACVAGAFAMATPADAVIVVTNNANITLANSQVEVGGDLTENPDVTGGAAGFLVPYTATGEEVYGGDWGLSSLSDGDVGLGNPSDGSYTILTQNSLLTLDFGSEQLITSIAIYSGYNNWDDGDYVLLDGSDTVLGAYSIQTESPAADNDGADSFWLTFNTPVVTDSIRIQAENTADFGVSFREIQVFTAVPEPASLALMGVGGLLMMRRRRSQH